MGGEAEEVHPAGVNEQVLHILVVPFQAEGHVNGMLRLARALAAEEGVVVTFGYPARFYKLAQKRNNLSALLSPSSSVENRSILRLEVVEDGLPLGEDCVIRSQIIRASIPVYQSAETISFTKPSLPPLLQILLLCPLCLASSPTLLCHGRGILPMLRGCREWISGPPLPPPTPWAPSFLCFFPMAPCLCQKCDVCIHAGCWLDPEKKWIAEAPLIDCVPGLPSFPVTDLMEEFVSAEDVLDARLQFMVKAFKHAREGHTIMIHSTYELESQVFDALQERGFPVHSLGPLFDSVSEAPMSTQADEANHECLAWLDTQSPSSVIYVALGSFAYLTPAEMHSLALGLEASGHPFLWVIRRDSISTTVSDALPEGFLQRTVGEGSGLIISWAPQTKVLKHSSVGAFFSHCGWNSTLESMWEGVPMVACPRAAEQRSNARWIVEKWKSGVELERQKDGSFTKEAVERAVNLVLAREGTQACKERALHVKEVVRHAVQKGGSSYSNLVSFLQRLRS